jgi:hypothetical protein
MTAYVPPATGSGSAQRGPAKPPPVIARILAVTIRDGKVFITIGAGRNSGVRSDWIVQLLRGDSDEALPGRAIAIVRVDAAVTMGQIEATPDQLRSNPRVKLSPP